MNRWLGKNNGRYGRHWSAVVIASLAMTAGGSAAAPLPDTGGTGGTAVTIRTVTDDAVTGTLRSLSLSDGAAVVTVGGKKQRIAITELIHIATDATADRKHPGDLTVTLTNGDVVFGRLTDAEPDTLAVETLALGRLRWPLDLVARVAAPRAAGPAYWSSAAWLDRAGDSDEDRILLTNGDVVRGFVIGAGSDGFAIDTAIGENVIGPHLLVAVRFASPPADPPVGPYAIVRLRDGARITLTKLEWAGDVVSGVYAGDRRARFKPTAVASLDMLGGRWEPLSLHQPVEFVHTPMLSLGFAYRKDRNVLGGPIRVAGKAYQRGIGVHSRSTLVYDLAGKYREFVTAFGVDDRGGPLSDVSVSILVDGQRRLDREHVRRGELIGPVRVDVRGGERLELLVDFGASGDLQDRFNWVDPALIR
ncbi:MAG: NPCBM/NEW2 domain-containing protein [Phycisphaerae bacterium]